MANIDNLQRLVRGYRDSGTPLPLAAPFVGAGSDWIETPLNTQPFGPLPMGAGIAVKDGTVSVQTSALEGDLDCGIY